MKKILKHIAAVAALLMPALCVAAAYRSVAVLRTDGTEITVNGEKGLTLVFNDEEMRFTTPDNQYLAFPLSDVKGWRFSTAQGETPWSGIDETVADNQVTVIYAAGAVVLLGLPENSVVTLRTIAGAQLYRMAATGSLTVDLTDLSSGLYLLTYNKTTLKLAVR